MRQLLTLTLAVILHGQIIYIGFTSLRYRWADLSRLCNVTCASISPVNGEPRQKVEHHAACLLASGVSEVDAMLPSDMFRYEPVDEVRRGIC